MQRVTGLSEDIIKSELELKREEIEQSYNGSGSLDGYTYVCMFRHFASQYRKWKPPIVKGTYDIGTTDKTDHDKTWWLDKLKDLISPRDYDILYMRFGRGMMNQEIAEIIGSNKKNVSRRIGIAKKKIKTLKLDKLYQTGEK